MTDHADHYRDRRVLVTGAAGYIGFQLSRQLASAGADLHVSLRSQTGEDRFAASGISATIHKTDLSDPQQVEDLITRAEAEVVFNLAAYGVRRHQTVEGLAQRINAALPVLLGETMVRVASTTSSTRLIHIGSAAEYGGVGSNLSEDGPTVPLSLYGRTKLEGTRKLIEAARRRAVTGIVVRLFTVYGTGEPEGRLLPTLLAAVKSSKPVPLTQGHQQRDFTFVGDVVEGLMRAGQADITTGTVINLATGRLISVREFVERAAKVLGIAPERLRFGAVEARPDEMAHEPVTIERCRTLLNWLPTTSIEEGVKRTLAEPL